MKGSYFDPLETGFTYDQMIRYASDYDLLTSFIMDCKEENYKETANRIREKYFVFLCKMLMEDKILKDGFINYPIITKQWHKIYDKEITSEFKKNTFKNERYKNKKQFFPYKED